MKVNVSCFDTLLLALIAFCCATKLFSGEIIMSKKVSNNQSYDYSVHVMRRKELRKAIKSNFENVHESSVIVLFAGFESEELSFRQESTFYYFSGL